jgi:hypothetical protein
VGVSANVFGTGFPPKFIPSFSWGGAEGFTTYRLDKAIETAGLVLQRKDEPLPEEDQSILGFVFRETEKFRD